MDKKARGVICSLFRHLQMQVQMGKDPRSEGLSSSEANGLIISMAHIANGEMGYLLSQNSDVLATVEASFLRLYWALPEEMKERCDNAAKERGEENSLPFVLSVLFGCGVKVIVQIIVLFWAFAKESGLSANFAECTDGKMRRISLVETSFLGNDFFSKGIDGYFEKIMGK